MPTDPPDAARLAAIRQRCDAATPGPWKIFHMDSLAGGQRRHIRHAEQLTWIAELNINDSDDADGEFIANAIEDLPYLLTRVATLEQDRDKWQAHHDAMVKQNVFLRAHIETLTTALRKCTCLLVEERNV